MDSSKIKMNYKKWLAQVVDDDLSERADRVVAMASQKDFGFKDQSGNLRGSIHKERFPNPNAPGYRIVADATDIKGNAYGYWVEVGHPKRAKKDPESGDLVSSGNIAGRPFLLPALEAAKDQG